MYMKMSDSGRDISIIKDDHTVNCNHLNESLIPNSKTSQCNQNHTVTSTQYCEN